MMRSVLRFCLFAWLVLLLPASSFACSVCYGNPDSAMGQGARWGVLVMIGVVGSVLGGISVFFVVLGKRSAAVAKSELESASKELTDKV